MTGGRVGGQRVAYGGVEIDVRGVHNGGVRGRGVNPGLSLLWRQDVGAGHRR